MAGLIEFYFKLTFYSGDVWNMWNNVWDVEYVKYVEIRIKKCTIGQAVATL
jgi:hypothetical protein